MTATKYDRAVAHLVEAKAFLTDQPQADVLRAHLSGFEEPKARFTELREACLMLLDDAEFPPEAAGNIVLPEPLPDDAPKATITRQLNRMCDYAETVLGLIKTIGIRGATRQAIWDLQGRLPPEDRRSADALQRMTEVAGRAWLAECQRRRDELDRQRDARDEQRVEQRTTARLQPLLDEMEGLRRQITAKDGQIAALTTELETLRARGAAMADPITQADVERTVTTAVDKLRTEVEGKLTTIREDVAKLPTRNDLAEAARLIGEQCKITGEKIIPILDPFIKRIENVEKQTPPAAAAANQGTVAALRQGMSTYQMVIGALVVVLCLIGLFIAGSMYTSARATRANTVGTPADRDIDWDWNEKQE